MSEVLKVIGLDFGSKTLGVAICDDLGLMAHPLMTIKRERESKLRSTLTALREIINTHKVELIVLGLPLNSDGSMGERAIKTIAFRDLLCEKLKIKIILIDESLTTIESDEILYSCHIPLADRKKYLDSLAAAVILQEYLNNKSFFDEKANN